MIMEKVSYGIITVTREATKLKELDNVQNSLGLLISMGQNPWALHGHRKKKAAEDGSRQHPGLTGL